MSDQEIYYVIDLDWNISMIVPTFCRFPGFDVPKSDPEKVYVLPFFKFPISAKLVASFTTPSPPDTTPFAASAVTGFSEASWAVHLNVRVYVDPLNPQPDQ